MPRFSPAHLAAFLDTPFQPQAPSNPLSPREWARQVLGIERESLPAHALDRQGVRDCCLPGRDVLDGYLAVMAWGMQGVSTQRRYAAMAWHQRAVIESNLKQLQQRRLTRAEAFELFRARKIPGLGPAYFTKLLQFFAPWGDTGPDRYIMDRWTSLSMNLLTGEHIPRVAKTVDRQTQAASYNLVAHATPAEYEAFCTEIDALAEVLNQHRPGHVHTGHQVEQMLFSQGAMPGPDGREQRHPWRAYVLAQFEAGRPQHPYDAGEIRHRNGRWPPGVA